MKNKLLQRTLGILLSLMLSLSAFSFVGCEPEKKQLATPTNLVYDSENGVIKWDAVPNATGYVLKFNNDEKKVTGTSFIVEDLTSSFVYSVIATAEGYENSAETEVMTFKAKLVKPSVTIKDDLSGIKWEAVKNAKGYVVKVGEKETATSSTEFAFAAEDKAKDFEYSVWAVAERYVDSDKFVGNYRHYRAEVTVTIPANLNGYELSAGSKVALKNVATVAPKKTGEAINTAVTWSAVSGGDLIKIDGENIEVTYDGAEDKEVVVRATSVENEAVYADLTLKLVGKVELTQDMIDALSGDRLSVVGSMKGVFVNAQTGVATGNAPTASYKMELDGAKLYTEYQALSATAAGNKVSRYFEGKQKPADPNAETDTKPYVAEATLDINNKVSYDYRKTQDGDYVLWANSGFTNNLSAFVYSNFTWGKIQFLSGTKFGYAIAVSNAPASVQGAVVKVMASLVPYGVIPSTLALQIEDGEIVGFDVIGYTQSAYGSGRVAKVECNVSFVIGETSAVPACTPVEAAAYHTDLTNAINEYKSAKIYDTMIMIGSSTSQLSYSVRVTENGVYSIGEQTTATSTTPTQTILAFYNKSVGEGAAKKDYYQRFRCYGPFEGDTTSATKQTVLLYEAQAIFAGTVNDLKATFDLPTAGIFTMEEGVNSKNEKIYTYTTSVSEAAGFFHGAFSNIMKVQLYANSSVSVVLDKNKKLSSVSFNGYAGSVAIAFAIPEITQNDPNEGAPDYTYGTSTGAGTKYNAFRDGIKHCLDKDITFTIKYPDPADSTKEKTEIIKAEFLTPKASWAEWKYTDKNVTPNAEKTVGGSIAERMCATGATAETVVPYVIDVFGDGCFLGFEFVTANDTAKTKQLELYFADFFIDIKDGEFDFTKAEAKLDTYLKAQGFTYDEAKKHYKKLAEGADESTAIYASFEVTTGTDSNGMFHSYATVRFWNKTLQDWTPPATTPTTGDSSDSGSNSGS